MPAAFNNWNSFPISTAIYLSKDLEFSILESYLKSVQQIFVEKKGKMLKVDTYVQFKFLREHS